MPEPGNTETQETKAPGQSATHTVTSEQLIELQSKFDKRIANLEKQLSIKESALADVEAELDGLKSSSNKTDPEIVELKKTLRQRELQLERERKQLDADKHSLAVEKIAKEYGVDVDELKDFKSPLEMENYALKATWNKSKTQKPSPPADRSDRQTGSPSNYSESLKALAEKDTNNMTKAEQQEHLRKLIQGISSL